jgi:UDP-N-acetylglucosamine diphosphorylase/glucosamine-1-phosphate N-acetyltransferase
MGEGNLLPAQFLYVYGHVPCAAKMERSFMRLILVDRSENNRRQFWPLVLSRPIWELRCGMTSLGEKLQAKVGTNDVAYFVPDYMAEVYRERTGRPVNEMSALAGQDVLIVDPRAKADTFDVPATGRSEVGLDEQGQVLYARIAKGDAKKVHGSDIDAFLESAKISLPTVKSTLPTWQYTWDLMLASPHQITADFAAAGRQGIEGTIEEPAALRGSKKDVYVAPGVTVHPMVVIDAEHGPVYIDEGAEIQPFTRIEGPCYIGKKSILLGAKCREGNSIGPYCRIGGEVEESVIQGYSNKYHDGFLGHAYVGEWVNLGALTTNSDLKNDYSTVSVMLDGKHSIDTGSTKVGSLIGDHTKTSIGVLFNTGSVIGAMALIMATGKPLPKFIPSFAWFIEGVVTKGFGKKILYETANTAMGRRKQKWTPAQQAMWDQIFEMTAEPRDEAVKKGRRAMMK